MAVTSKNLRSNRAPQHHKQAAVPAKQLSRLRLPWLSGSLAKMLLSALLVLVVFAVVDGWAKTKLDDLRYGRPRTDKLSAFVGHEVSGMPTQFVALNLNRRVLIMEFPGGDATQARTIVGPYLFGQDEDLTPVTLDLRDLNGDELPELLVTVKNEVLVYLNEPSGFRTLTPEEHIQFADQLPE